MKEHGVTFPVMIDTGVLSPNDFIPGETINRYGSEVLPNFFLIDKSGKPIWGYGMAPPTGGQISHLLISGETAPALGAGEWFNTVEPHSLEGLAGKGVVLVFWSGAGRPTAQEWKQLEAIRANGAPMIGICRPATGADLAQILKEKAISMPVLVDSGETARRYDVDDRPRYILIDKAGKITQSRVGTTPTKAEVDELSK